MNRLSCFLLVIFVALAVDDVNAQFSKTVNDFEIQHKECLRIKPDSTACSRVYFSQLDSILPIVLERLKAQLDVAEKTALIQEQSGWAKKKGEFFKVQDETFKYNLQEGIWKKDMIRITYQQKAEFILKRIKSLLKRLKE
jgi:hypothetical protein